MQVFLAYSLCEQAAARKLPSSASNHLRY
jgi:hypothetical protein